MHGATIGCNASMLAPAPGRVRIGVRIGRMRRIGVEDRRLGRNGLMDGRTGPVVAW
jgi:hypothetical protein